MTSRDDLIETAARALAELEPGDDWPTKEALAGSLTGARDAKYRAAIYEDAARVLDAVLPQITTAEQLEALPKNTILLSDAHVGAFERWAGLAPDPWRSGSAMYWTSREVATRFAPLTVVWQP